MLKQIMKIDANDNVENQRKNILAFVGMFEEPKSRILLDRIG
jgi:hypothetical protein